MCSGKASGATICSSQRMAESDVYEAFNKMLFKLKEHHHAILGALIRDIKVMQSKTSENHEKIAEIDKEIADLAARNLVIVRLHTSGILNDSDYSAQSSEINNKISTLRSERKKKLAEDEGDEQLDKLKELQSISANVRWGKAQSAKEGNVPFQYKRFLGYRRGSDGKPEIDPEQAVVVKRIYERFLAGDSLATIANDLNADGIPTSSGNGQWQRGTIASILTNEKYKGDAILNKTYIRDCLSKKVMINNGERPKYYVENNHPAIIDSATFGRVQEEMARRSGKRKVKQVGTKTEQGRYSSKYALTELLICGECGTPYRRCTWAANGKKKVVWRCINRLDYGKKYCHDSPSIEESVLQEAIMKAVMQTAKQNAEVLKTLKLLIGMGLSAETTEDNSLDLQIRIAEIEAEFQKMLKAIAADNIEAFDEEKAKALMDEKAKLQIQLDRIADTKQKRENAKSRLDEIFMIIEALANHPISYDDQIVRQILESVIVESKEKIKVVFVGGLEVTQLM